MTGSFLDKHKSVSAMHSHTLPDQLFMQNHNQSYIGLKGVGILLNPQNPQLGLLNRAIFQADTSFSMGLNDLSVDENGIRAIWFPR